MGIHQAAHEWLAVPDDKDVLIQPIGPHVRLDIEIVEQLGDDQPHLVPSQVHADAVARTQRERLIGATLVVFVGGVAKPSLRGEEVGLPAR